MAKEFKISALRLKELEQELFYLKTTREKEVAEQIKEARSFGDTYYFIVIIPYR